jgi:hypothetical protein
MQIDISRSKKPILIYFIFAFLFLLIVTTNISLGIKFDAENQAKDVAKKLTGLDKPLHVVIGIDSSASMQGSEEAKSAAIEILESIKNRKISEDRVGFVSWKHFPAYSSKSLSTDYGNITNIIRSIDFDGNTCLKLGLNESINLLKISNPNSSAFNILVLISDGIDNCNTSMGNISCDQIRSMNFTNVYVYPIQIGNAENETDLLRCLTKEIPSNYPVYNVYPKTFVGVTKSIHEENTSEFSLPAHGRIIKYQEITTKVNVTKIVEKGNNGPKIRIRIEAPDANVSDAIVLAIDSSGSFGDGGYPDFGKNLREAMNPSLGYIKKILPNSTIAILSWDREINFAYDNLSNKDPKNARFVPISQAIDDIRNNNVFVASNLYYGINLLNHKLEFPIYATSEPYPTRYYNCSEFDPTIFDVGLQGSLDLFESQFQKIKIDERDTVLKSIIFITGRSEFTPFSNNSIERANKDNCTIYTVGIGVKEKSLMQKNLFLAANKTHGDDYYSSGGSDWTKNDIANVITKVADRIREKPLLDNITLTETTYPYLKVDPSSIKVTKDGIGLKYNPIRLRPNSDGTTTLTIELKAFENLTRNSAIEISMDTDLDLSLPVDVNQFRRDISWTLDENTRPSSLSYRWIKPEQKFEVLLPENSINF